MRWWRVGGYLGLRLHQVVPDQEIYIHPVFELVFCVQSGHNVVGSAVATVFHGRLLSIAKRLKGCSRLQEELVVIFRHGGRMVSCH